MNRIKSGVVLFLLGVCWLHTYSQEPCYYQYGTIGGLLEGQYDGEETVLTLQKRNNFGIGTFNALNGELILYNGEVWRAVADTARGAMVRAREADAIPYSVSCNFVADTSFQLTSITSFKQFEAKLDSVIAQRGIPTAILVEGLFADITTRSVSAQTKPYKRLSEAVKQQAIFNFKNTAGVLVGFYTPAALKEIAVAGYHLHFLSLQKNRGGHLLNFAAEKISVKLCWLNQFHVEFAKNNTPVLNASQAETNLIERQNK